MDRVEGAAAAVFSERESSRLEDIDNRYQIIAMGAPRNTLRVDIAEDIDNRYQMIALDTLYYKLM